MRIYFLIAMFFFLTVQTAVGQTASPDPTPTPKPVSKRRTFDQFDLSTGVGVGASNSNTNSNATSRSTVTEFVDRQTFDGIAKLVEYVAQMDSEYRSTEGQTFDPTDRFQPESVLNRKLNAAYRLTEMFSSGLLDQEPLKNQNNIALLADSQNIIIEALAVAAVRGDWTNNQRKLAELADKYGAGSTEKRALLTAMVGRLNRNLTRLKSQIAFR